MSAINVRDLRKINETVGAAETNLVIAEFGADFESALHFRADLVCSSVTVGTGITAKLQHRAKGGSYEDLGSANASVAITGNGSFSITLLVERSADQVDLPLRQGCRLVVTTGTGSAITFDTISVQQK
jgi:hypothetical protein